VRGGHGTTSSGYGRYSSEKNGTKEKTLQQKGTKSEENMFVFMLFELHPRTVTLCKTYSNSWDLLKIFKMRFFWRCQYVHQQ
jgi:hypothetical protein